MVTCLPKDLKQIDQYVYQKQTVELVIYVLST